jgi:hypothetical protein
MANTYGPNESGFNITIRKDGRFTITSTAIPQEAAAAIARIHWNNIIPGHVARMIGLIGPLDARGCY